MVLKSEKQNVCQEFPVISTPSPRKLEFQVDIFSHFFFVQQDFTSFYRTVINYTKTSLSINLLTTRICPQQSRAIKYYST